MSSSSSSSSAADAGAADANKINEEFKIWKKNCPFLYDIVVTHALEWPSLTCDWLPNAVAVDEDHSAVHSVVLGTHVAEGGTNELLLANVTLPTKTAGWDDVQASNNSGGGGDANATTCLEIVKRFPHAGEVNRARHMPQNPKLVATIGASGEVLLYHLDQKENSKHGGVVGKCTKGHGDEGYGLQWSQAQTARLVTAANDGSVCWWDVANPSMKTNPTVKLSDSKGASINDLAISRTSADIAYTVGEAKRVDVWDARKKGGPVSSRQGAHDAELMSVGAAPLSEHLLLTGCADGVVKLWDARKMTHFIHAMGDVHAGAVTAVRWSPHHVSHFMSGGDDRRVNIWDLGRIGQEQSEEDGRDGPPELLFCHGGHTGAVTDVSWNLSGEGSSDFLVASVSDDNIFQCWQMQASLYSADQAVDAGELEAGN